MVSEEAFTMRRTALRLVVTLLVVAGFVTPARAQGPTNCSTLGQNLFVRDVLNDLYFWYQHVPNVDAARFDSPEAYLDAVRYRPLDTTFSYIADRQSSEVFFSDSQFIGLGLSTSTSETSMRVLQVFPESPAQESGLARGDWIREINGRSVSDLIGTGAIDSAFGPSTVGIETDIAFENSRGQTVHAHMVKRLVSIPTVSLTRVYEADGRKIGYVFFRNFVEPSYDALDKAFAELRDARVNELVLDLRYNGGGLVAVAQHLASLIGGVVTDGQLFAEYFHNDRYTVLNRSLRFQPKANALALQRLIVITTRGSASASELVINALRPYMAVVVIGDRTYGKPVGQYVLPFCDKILAPVSFTLRNARGEGDFFDGFAPDCVAADDVSRQLGDVQEASLGEALTFARSGRCSPQALTAQAMRSRPRARRAVGWQSVVNAY
jgi:C-terminal peptidase prc